MRKTARLLFIAACTCFAACILISAAALILFLTGTVVGYDIFSVVIFAVLAAQLGVSTALLAALLHTALWLRDRLRRKK
ncbi:MAG TPA: hypothetical protein VNU47_00505 [Candidatus Paceibacterota bacterium]|nr:hypothetical protein [Candidatus Paceibacterota bacterium]